MTDERDFDRLARAWLEQGPDEAPDRVIAAVLQAAETAPQARRTFRRSPWRTFQMTRLPLVAGAAAVLVVVVGGGIMLGQRGQTGVGGVAPTPTPSPTATPSPTPTPRPSVVTLSGFADGRVFNQGAYRVGPPFGRPFEFAVESDWGVDSLKAGQFSMSSRSGRDAWVLIDLVENVFADPCRSNDGPVEPPVASTVEAVLAGLSAMPAFTVGPTTDVVIDGHDGKEFDLTNTLDPATAACDGGQMIPLWTFVGGGRTETNPGLKEHLILLDVGGSPVAINWGAEESSSAEVDRIVRTLDFE